MDFRAKLSDLLDKSSMSIRQLAVKSGVRRQSIMRFLSGGNIHIDNLKKILEALGCELKIAEIDNRITGSSKSILFERLGTTKEKLEKFCKKHKITYLAFFGSVLRGDFRKDSDIDVVMEVANDISLFELVGIEQDLKKLLNTDHRIDLLTKESISPLIRDEIEENLEVIYEEAA